MKKRELVDDLIGERFTVYRIGIADCDPISVFRNGSRTRPDAIASADDTEQAAELPQVDKEARKDDVDVPVGHTKYYTGTDSLRMFPRCFELFGSSIHYRVASRFDMFEQLTRGLLTIRPVWAGRESFLLGMEFRELIGRSRAQGIGMHGLEVFTATRELLDVVFSEDGAGSDLCWVEMALLKWPEPQVLFSGSMYRLDEDDQKSEAVVDIADALDAFLASRGES